MRFPRGDHGSEHVHFSERSFTAAVPKPTLLEPTRFVRARHAWEKTSFGATYR